MIKITCLFWIFLIIIFINKTFASLGDSTTFFQKCKLNCITENCTDDGYEFLSHAKDYFKQTIFDKILLWTCDDECQYFCMFRTVNAFLERDWPVPQFYGKWPFIRIFGLQEPASVLFSLMNIAANVYLLRKFRKEVKSDSPCYWLWQIFYGINLNGWIWSTIFHARDFPITELFDYASAYSIVLANLYCMVIRMVCNRSIILRGILSAAFLSFYLNYFAYLSVGDFSYHYNMKVNLVTGVLAGISWIMWCIFVYRKRSYCWKMCSFYILFGISMCLELLDFPPILWTFDAHSLWHLSSVPLNFLLYSFIRDDCNALRTEKLFHLKSV